MIRLTIGNQRGGVGKTTTAVTLARLWAERGLRTLLVDADPQGSIGSILKIKPELYLNDFPVEQAPPCGLRGAAHPETGCAVQQPGHAGGRAARHRHHREGAHFREYLPTH